MKYKVCTFHKGNVKGKSVVVASSHQQAADIARKLGVWTHVVVVGKTVKRYTREGKIIKGLPKVFKTTKNTAHCILLMFGGVAELHRYTKFAGREEAWEKLCTVLESAAYASATPAPKDITASSVETSDSRNTLTSKKISNGYVMTAIWKVLETPMSIEKDFGKPSVADMEEATWSGGYEVSPSKQTEEAFIVTIEVEGHDASEYPSINEHMKRMHGKCIKVTCYEKDLWFGEGFYWQKKWLNFRKAKAIVKPVPAGACLGSVSFTEAMIKTIGDVVNIRPCTDHYTADNGWCYESEWLEPYNEEQVKPTKFKPLFKEAVENPFLDKESIEALQKELDDLQKIKTKFKVYSDILQGHQYEEAMKKSKTIYTTDGS